jgi:hypothetical protein
MIADTAGELLRRKGVAAAEAGPVLQTKRLRAERNKSLRKAVYWPVNLMGTEGARGISAERWTASAHR